MDVRHLDTFSLLLLSFVSLSPLTAVDKRIRFVAALAPFADYDKALHRDWKKQFPKPIADFIMWYVDSVGWNQHLMELVDRIHVNQSFCCMYAHHYVCSQGYSKDNLLQIG
jgi:hypothetical protein